ncbi:DNA polymerase [Patescibacteria group bacterium]|nr:DNA polymerase [Patescibacteria group bacterium]MCL5410122.1 DNA polymerase [Patescibacteria group bacterium]
MKRLVLIDGNALLHRAYHATPPLSTKSGELVNAVYGFSLMLLKTFEQLHPEYLAIAWDMKAPTFRHAQYAEYKANRGPADEALSAQYDRVFAITKAFNIPEYKLPGFEADDLVGALAKQAEKLKEIDEIVIVTGDRDIMQLIDQKIKVLMPKKTLNDVGLYGEEEFAARFGFTPQNLVDYKALAGDTSDNIPGVPGIGEVTATKLVHQYQTLETIYLHLDDLPVRTKQLLEDGFESAQMSKKLATLETEVPIRLDLESCKLMDFDPSQVVTIFEQLDFKSLISKIPGLDSTANIISSNDNISDKNSNTQITQLDEQTEAVLQKMTANGVLINLKLLNEFGEDLKSKLAKLEDNIYSTIGHQININSPKQLSELLFDELQLPVVKKTKTGRSTDEESLLQLKDAHPVVSLILEYRQLFKLISTYIDALPKYVQDDGRIHSTFNVEGAATGRLSSQNPNLQNIPIKGQLGSEIRKIFIVPQDKLLLGADYSQIELRVMAHLADDSGLKRAFQEGVDIHKLTASKIFKVPLDQVSKEQRMVGKTMNFATLYGQGAHALSRQLGVDFATAKQYIEEYFAQFPQVRNWMAKTLQEAREKGFVETMWGRRRYFPELSSQNRMFQAAGERAAINHPVQGTAADMIKKAMVEIDKELGQFKSKMILQVHDELLFESDPQVIREVAQMVKIKMENALKLSVPVIAELKMGPNWGEMEPLNL